jgi:transposase
MEAEAIKRMGMREFLHSHYGMTFERCGEGYRCLSPFTQERDPSFIVREVEGRWLFKDFSSGHGGSLIDFVMVREGLADAAAAMSWIAQRCRGAGGGDVAPTRAAETADAPAGARERGYDVGALYATMRSNDVTPCVEYLRGRAIAEPLIEELRAAGVLLHNRYKDRSYCCFAVHDAVGTLRCLDNHQIGGDGKFVLGHKHVFSRDWERLPVSEAVFVAEGIIDYLSVKTLEGAELPGLALLGRDVHIERKWVKAATVIMSALDSDDAGVEAFFDLQGAFMDKEVSVYQMEGKKDPNEYAQAIRAGHKPHHEFTNRQRREIYEAYLRAENKSTVAAKWGINRSYMYEVVQQCKKSIDDAPRRPPGPRPKKGNKPTTLEEALERIEQLEAARLDAEKEKELYYAKSEFLKVRIKFCELDNAELRGEVVPDDADEAPVQRQIKKKRNP